MASDWRPSIIRGCRYCQPAAGDASPEPSSAHGHRAPSWYRKTHPVEATPHAQPPELPARPQSDKPDA